MYGEVDVISIILDLDTIQRLVASFMLRLL
jgi:hypothetical protein